MTRRTSGGVVSTRRTPNRPRVYVKNVVCWMNKTDVLSPTMREKKNNPKLIICCRTKEKKNNIKILTLISIIAKGVEHGHGDVDQAGQVEGDAPPQRDVAWEPEQGLIFCTNTTGSISTGTQNLGTQTRKCRCRPLSLFWNNNNQTLWVIIMISHPAASVCYHHHYLYIFLFFFKREPDSEFKDSLRIFFCHRISL